ncbi:hypothetical protein OH687_28885 [Burkholderia anthina]|nr:hypothetical protein OH687_28885 [Burkholderia anthina]
MGDEGPCLFAFTALPDRCDVHISAGAQIEVRRACRRPLYGCRASPIHLFAASLIAGVTHRATDNVRWMDSHFPTLMG